MSSLLRGVFVVGAKRTAFGAFGGRLKDVGSVEMAEITMRAALAQAKLSPEQVDSVTVGNVIQISQRNGPYIARHAALRAGVRIEVPALTVNRLCGSGLQSVVTAAQDICLRDSDIALASSSESMSQAPFVVRGARFGVKFSQAPDLECSIWTTLTDHNANIAMGMTAEKLSERYQLTREQCDQFALSSQQRWAAAQKAGRFADEIVPVEQKGRRGKVDVFDVDEHPKPETTLEGLAKLPTVFKKDGTVTAGSASGVCDGAATLVLASEESVTKLNLKPLARVVGYSVVGCEPTEMGIGPVGAIQRLCERTGVSLSNVDVIEVNEAFAAQFLAVQKQLNLDPSKTNVNGGAIALGHPIGASGGRILANLSYELFNGRAKTAIGSACIGGGQGIAVMLEKVN